MKQCAKCKNTFPAGYPSNVCYVPVGEAGGLAIACKGEIREVNCLLCEDSGEVQIRDPRIGPEYRPCPRGCSKGGF